MIYVVFVLVYLIGGAGTLSRAVIDDSKVRERVKLLGSGHLPRPPAFRSYLFCYLLLWPLAIWFVLYNLWMEFKGE